MARRSLRAAASQASSATTTPQKRSAGAEKTSSARSKRSKPSTPSTVRVTPKKSQHFNRSKNTSRTAPTADDEEQSDAFEEPPTPSSTGDDDDDDDDDDSGYEEANGDAPATSDDDEASVDVSDASDDDTPRSRKRKAPPTNKASSSAGRSRGQELWRPGVKAGLGPGTQVVIDKPRARAAGKTPYTADTIHPNTMLFLGDLAANNDREWLKMHDPDYRASLQDFNSFVESLQTKICDFDPTIPELPLKDIVFRIYRDIRFSKDPTPYKAHFSVAWSRTGRKGPFAAYYLQIKPGGCFVGGGLWQPEARPLALLRRAIDRRPQRLTAVLLDKGVQREFLAQKGKAGAVGEAAAVKAFAAQNSESALKTKPKGYESDHPNIALLRLRNFTLGHRFEDGEVVGPKGLQRVAEVLSCLEPFVTYLNSIVMPDDPQDSDSDNEDNNDNDDD